jgi:hypothetical protein
MKNIFVISALLLTLHVTQAQHKNDPTYSVHNYKHLNKATEASENGYEELQHFNYADVKNTAGANYKAQNIQHVTTSSGTLPTTPTEKNVNGIHARGNYKRQF